MAAIMADRLDALKQGFDTSLTLQMRDYRADFERKLLSVCQDAEDNAFRRSEESFTRRQLQVSDEIKAYLQAAVAQYETAMSKVDEVARAQAALRKEMMPLHNRADVVMERVDAIERQVQAASTASSSLFADHRETIEMLRNNLKQSDVWRTELGVELGDHIAVLREELTRSICDVEHKRCLLEEKAIPHMLRLLEDRSQQRLDAYAHQALLDARNHASESYTSLKSEFMSTMVHADAKCEEVSDRIEATLRSVAGELRAEIASSGNRVQGESLRCVDENVRRLTEKFEESLEAIRSRAQEQQAFASQSLESVTADWRGSLAALRESSNAETEKIRHQLSKVEAAAAETLKLSARQASDAVSRKLQENSSELANSLAQSAAAVERNMEEVRRAWTDRFEAFCESQDKRLEDVTKNCMRSADASLALATAELTKSMVKGISGFEERLQEVRAQCMATVAEDVATRSRQFAADDDARQSLTASLREEARQSCNGVEAKSLASLRPIQQRADANTTELRELQKSFEAFQRLQADALEALQGQLQASQRRQDATTTELTRQLERSREAVEQNVRCYARDAQAQIMEIRRRLSLNTHGLRRELYESGATKVDVAKALAEASIEWPRPPEGHSLGPASPKAKLYTKKAEGEEAA
eukprot:TRINITY_DN14547_c0_g1_i2.p1 TRINITY_DN14547_c0_g1~~TRINITY_DN14547_c0_g1_i2.p1  ORF type:complete len:648 (+),score=184.73 TRINITY_DN14547_c0_g1_i2:205-2148(+)